MKVNKVIPARAEKHELLDTVLCARSVPLLSLSAHSFKNKQANKQTIEISQFRKSNNVMEARFLKTHIVISYVTKLK